MAAIIPPVSTAFVRHDVVVLRRIHRTVFSWQHFSLPMRDGHGSHGRLGFCFQGVITVVVAITDDYYPD